MLAPVSTSDTWTDTITQNKRGAFHLERGALKYQGVKTSESQPLTCAASLSCSAPLRRLLSTQAEPLCGGELKQHHQDGFGSG